GSSSAGNEDFSNASARFGSIIVLAADALISFLRYRTNLCASVATKVVSSGLIWQKTPVIAGRSSSLLTAKIVLLMDSNNTEDESSTEEAFSITGIFGKSSAFSPLNLYLPSPALISIAEVCRSTINEIG